MFESMRAKIEALRLVAPRACVDAAPRIEARLRADATTKRGNVPSFGRMGDVPIVASADGDAVEVSAPSWVHDRARAKGQSDAWAEILAASVHDEVTRALGGGS